ncbi:VanZ family protein [Ketobacter sp. MCCC 1A13808]|uniref:VanZ family protein n=1 Tax=Ketobacter sp. MCCC 1A13808 TaxID=2602738 RepID=UPI000F0D7145|nr:VanZ family protein [Ketobacter sp. MCCC 1A13808]MVF10714.1 VanZ family protein [Ketobacter sp. MCCC 1A13808]RLP56132.1 MAG: VanZ family protein [Ketobacter sp.]
MIVVPLKPHQLCWAFRIALLINLTVISWLAFTASKVQIAELATDKVNHFAAFFVLSYCLDRGFPGYNFFKFKFVPLFLYGVSIELLQSELAYREFSLWDLLADVIAVGAYWLVRKPFRQLVVARGSSSA